MVFEINFGVFWKFFCVLNQWVIRIETILENIKVTINTPRMNITVVINEPTEARAVIVRKARKAPISRIRLYAGFSIAAINLSSISVLVFSVNFFTYFFEPRMIAFAIIKEIRIMTNAFAYSFCRISMMFMH